MKWNGTITELGFDLDECDFDVDEAVVTRNRISIDWKEDDLVCHVVLKSSDGGETFAGNYGTPVPKKEWFMEAKKYTAADKSILLLSKWYQTDNGREGSCIIELFPAD